MIIKKFPPLPGKEQERMSHEIQEITTPQEKTPSIKSVLITLFILALVFTFIAYFPPK